MTELTDQNFEAEITKLKGLAVVDFWAPWCGPCRTLGPIIEEIAKTYEGKVRFGKVNVDESPHTAIKFDIQSIPNVIFFSNGEMLTSVIGLNPKDTYTQLLEKALKDPTSIKE